MPTPPGPASEVLAMRSLASMFLCLAAVGAHATDKAVDEKKVVSAIEKTGAKVTVVESEPAGPKLKVTFAKWDASKALSLKGSPYVTFLVVEDAARVTDQTMALFASLPNLERLDLFKPSLTAAGLKPFKAHKTLKSLTLFDAKVGDAAVADLKDVDTLEELDLSKTLITNQSAFTFQKLDNLKVLTVAMTKFNGKGALLLKDMPKLKQLHALNCDISVDEAKELEKAIKGIKIER